MTITASMRRSSSIAGVLLLLFFGSIPPLHAQRTNDTTLDAVLAAINESTMQKHLKVIAADDMQGRDTGSPGHQKAAEYIRKLEKEAGLASLVPDGSYFQPWVLSRSAEIKDGMIAWRRKTKSGQMKVTSERRADQPFEIIPGSGEGKVTGPVVFVGYGITAKEYDYDDYAGVDVRGKIVLCLRHEPRELDDRGWNGKTNTEYASFDSKLKNAVAHGAAALLVVTDPLNHDDSKRSPEAAPRNQRDRAVPPAKDRKDEIPALWVDYDDVKKMVGDGDHLLDWQKKIELTMQPQSRPIDDLSVTLQLQLAKTDVPTQNVCSFIEGSDPEKKSEFIVLGAHYDHVGTSDGAGSDKIFNGADDNGSGTTTLLSIALAMAKSGVKPKRSIAFLHFSGEEKGLLGSEYFVEHPLRPLEKIVAMLNMDMVGRNFDAGCDIIGTQFSSDLRSLIENEARASGLTEVEFKPGTDNMRLLDRSDQGPFLKKDIPIAFFTTGLHKDYHKVGDHWDLIKYGNMAKIGRTIARTALKLAASDSRPKFEKN